MLAPAEMDTLLEVPLRLKLVAAAVFGPSMVITCPLCDKVMLLPPTKVTPPDVMLVVAPAVLPDEICRELRTVELLVAAMVIVLPAWPRLTPAPAEIDSAPLDPFKLAT
jgi:hypothetical protein